MKKSLILAVSMSALLFFFLNASAQVKNRESTEWCHIWINHAADDSLPRVLLIGNSITEGYAPGVTKILEGRAYVCRITSAQFLSDPFYHATIVNVLRHFKFDVIHFNNGMHGWRHSEEEYRKAFMPFVKLIKKHAPKARLVWANTTPLKDTTAVKFGVPSNQRVVERNRIAVSLIKNKSIVVNDLYTLMAGHPEYHSDNIHFNEQAKALQAAQVAGIIEKLLPSQEN